MHHHEMRKPMKARDSKRLSDSSISKWIKQVRCDNRIDLLMPHQSSLWIVEALRKKISTCREQNMPDVNRLGEMASTFILSAFSEFAYKRLIGNSNLNLSSEVTEGTPRLTVAGDGRD